MNCPSCETPNPDLSRFCSACGTEMYNPSAAALPPIEHEATGVRETDSIKRELVDRSSDPLLGVTIAGKYRLDAKVCVGGMGAVYCATRLLIGDEVAVKILHSEQNDPRAADRFRREAQAAARLKHPNAVNIYDFGVTDDGLQYLVMEFVKGESLRRIIKQQGLLPCSTCAEILSQICAALDEAHRHNIIHRDIKPDNIIINLSEAGVRVKVLDFGIAKIRDDTADNLTQTGNVLGTPHYMSPEQCIGEELDSRSDIYSLGIVLYEMLSGRVPFNSPVSTAVVIQHVNQTPPSLRALNPSIPPAVETVALRALEKTREARPQSARELASAFEIAVRDGHTSPSIFSGSVQSSHVPKISGSLSSLPATALFELAPKNSEPTSQVRVSKRLRLIAASIAALLIFASVALYAFRWRANRGTANANALSNNSALSPDATTINFSKNFAGLVAGKFKMVLRLRRNGNDLSGTYFYQPTNDATLHGNFTKEPERWADKDNGLARIDVPIKGTVDNQQNFIIEEFDGKGSKTGIFNGRFVSDGEMEGTWSKPNGKNQSAFSLKDEGDATRGGAYTITTKRIAKRKGKLKITISYPQLEGLTDASLQKNFNDRVRALFNKDLGGTDDGEGSQDTSFTIDYRSADLLSIVFGEGSDWVGAAHPNSHAFSFNYDLKQGREIKLSDLFNPGANYLSIIGKLCAREIAKQKIKNGMPDIYEDVETAVETLKQDATFYLSEKDIVFIFDPYQVGSYAEGYYIVSIPYSQLSGIINPNGPLAPFVS